MKLAGQDQNNDWEWLDFYSKYQIIFFLKLFFSQIIFFSNYQAEFWNWDKGL